MIQRALVQVTGPARAGKTTLIEQVLRAFDGSILVARCIRDDSARSFRESTPKSHPELRRYRDAGACGAALFTYAAGELDLERAFDTELLTDFSHAILFEGDHDVDLAGLRIHVVPAPVQGQALLVRALRDRDREEREKADALESLLREPDGIARYFGQMFGSAAIPLIQGNPHLVEKARQDLLGAVQMCRRGPPLAPTEHWSIAPGFEGIELAQVVVVNLRDGGVKPPVERLLADLARIRKDRQVFGDVLGWRGKRIPITAAAAHLLDARHPGTKKVVARITRAMREN